jgi:hypothetical protein
VAKALIHVGTGDARQTYEYRHGKLLNVEVAAMERMSGLIGSDLEQALDKGGAGAMQALIWVLRKRQEPTLRFEQVVFNIEDMSVEIVNDDGSPLVDDEEGQEGVDPSSNGAQPAVPKEPAGHAKADGKKKSASKSSHSAATTS